MWISGLPVFEEDFYQMILPGIYDPTASVGQDSIESHNLAILYVIMAIGSLLDVEQPPRSAQSAKYYEMCRLALTLDVPLEDGAISAIQVLVCGRAHYSE